MNERIRELAEQATSIYQTMDGEWEEDFDKEKFAELIVRECIVDFYRRYLDVTSNEDITVQVERYVKEHFGINSSDNIRAGAEIHSDKGYSESTQEKYEEAKQRRERK